MEEPQYHYRGRGEIGNPDSSMREDVQLSVATGAGADDGVRLEFRSEQFPAGEMTLTPEQIEHLRRVLDGAALDDPAVDTPEAGVVYPDGRVDPDGWDDLP